MATTSDSLERRTPVTSRRPLVLWVDGAHSAAENMRRDAFLLERAAAVPSVPVLRLFAFDPPGITLGRAQDPNRDLDLARCRRDGVGWAVRPTGGRAIFHAEEWTFSLSAGLDDPEWGGSLARAYESVARLILASLVRLGVPAEFTRAPLPLSARPGLACFASAARHELLLGGRKLMGCAQRRTASALLQQGSVLLGDGHRRLVDYLALSDERRDVEREALDLSAMPAGAWLGTDQSLGRWALALGDVLGARFERLDGARGLDRLTLAKSD